MSLKNTILELGAGVALEQASGHIVKTTLNKTGNLKPTLAVQFVVGGLASVALLLFRGYLETKDAEDISEDTPDPK